MSLELPAALLSAERAPEIPEAADVYGWLVGSWSLEVRHYAGVDVAGRGLRGEVHAARVLEGRGVQDTWIMPPRGSRSGFDPGQNMYGTTLRTWDPSRIDRFRSAAKQRSESPCGEGSPCGDPAIQAWRIAWSNPARNHDEHQIGRWRGKDIVQLGARADGTATRWMFVEITPRSFHWLGDALGPDGQTWIREAEFVATRR